LKPFTYDSETFLLRGKRFRILAGAMHYFRIHPDHWLDRLLKLKAMGLNTVETYVAWNVHEPTPGEFRFDGRLDVAAYVRLAAKLGLYVIVRPGPYICSEWDMGGLPAWLLADSNMRLRCSHEPYLTAVDRYLDALLPLLAPLQITRGGPILAMQVENEYGNYGNDKDYLKYLADGFRGRQIDIPLFTSDGLSGEMLANGTLPGLLATVNFDSDVETAFANLRQFQPDGPLMCTEFWDGWFDHWGEEHHTRDAGETAVVLDKMLATGASVSFYMFHGGTNFGFMNGANCENGRYRPTITSYDYDAPLTEAGDPAAKYLAFREVIARHELVPGLAIPESSPKMALGQVELTEAVGLFDALDILTSPAQRIAPEPMEMLGQSHGFILYQIEISGPRNAADLTIRDVHDRALVFLDGRYLGLVEREKPETPLAFEIPPEGATLDILVENMGRVNYGPDLLDRKGITEGVLLGEQFLYGWTIYPLPLDDLSGLSFAAAETIAGPAFFRGTFRVTAAEDTFLALPGWTKGVCWINGFNLGRYWERGPQRTLYVPGPLLREGDNEVIVFELHRVEGRMVAFRDRPDLG
jgi:beta-galactosidase